MGRGMWGFKLTGASTCFYRLMIVIFCKQIGNSDNEINRKVKIDAVISMSESPCGGGQPGV